MTENIQILYNSHGIIVCVKPAGIPSEDSESTPGMPTLLANATKSHYIATIHRLDMAVSGVMVYASTKQAAAYLSNLVQNGAIRKEYLAIVHGIPDKTGVMEDILFKDSSRNKTFVVKRERKGTKPAKLEYEVLETRDTLKGNVSLVRILLHTGRTHQIRVQFSSRGFPLVGDGKYGSHDNNKFLCLMSYRLTFPLHNGEEKTFVCDDGIWDKLTLD